MMDPIAGLEMVSSVQVAEYYGVTAKELQKARTKMKDELDKLGTKTMGGVSVAEKCEEARRIDSNTYEVRLRSGEMMQIPASPRTYYTNYAVAAVGEELQRMGVLPEQLGDEKPVCVSADGFEVKTIPFMDSELIAVRDDDGNIWGAVRWICQGIGLTEGQMHNELMRVQNDVVISHSTCKFVLNKNRGNREVLCIKIKAIPFWIAKISITAQMKRDAPDVVEKLVRYQYEVEDVLAAAFLPQGRVVVPQEPAGDAEFFAQAVLAANRLLKEKDEHIAALTRR